LAGRTDKRTTARPLAPNKPEPCLPQQRGTSNDQWHIEPHNILRTFFGREQQRSFSEREAFCPHRRLHVSIVLHRDDPQARAAEWGRISRHHVPFCWATRLAWVPQSKDPQGQPL